MTKMRGHVRFQRMMASPHDAQAASTRDDTSALMTSLLLKPHCGGRPRRRSAAVIIPSLGIEQNSLAGRLNVDRNTASLIVEQLVKKELVERRVNGADRRARLLSLTPKGERLYAQLRPAHLAANQSILAPITPRERKLLISLLIRVIEGNLAQEDGSQVRARPRRR
jgi:DNA-binding MarR family transcriptional regulator